MAKMPVPDAVDEYNNVTGGYAGLDADFLERLGNDAEVTIPGAKDGGRYTQTQFEYMEWQLAHNKNLKKLTVDDATFDDADSLAKIIRAGGAGQKLEALDTNCAFTDGAATAIVDIAKSNPKLKISPDRWNLSQLAKIAEGAPTTIESFNTNLERMTPDAKHIAQLESVARAMNAHDGHITIANGELGDEGIRKLRQYRDKNGNSTIQGVELLTVAEKFIKNLGNDENIVISKDKVASLTSDEADKLAEKLKGNPNLHALSIDEVMQKNADLTKIITAADKDGFKSLSVKNLGVQGDSANAVANLLTNRSVENLELQNNLLQANDLKIIAPALALKDKKLATVDLSNNSIGDEGVKILAEKMTPQSGSPQGIKLNLTANNITDAAVGDIVALAKNLNLDPNRPASHIDLTGNHFSKEGLAQLASVKKYIEGVDGIPDPAAAPVASAPTPAPATPAASVTQSPDRGADDHPQQTQTSPRETRQGHGAGTQHHGNGTRALPKKPYHKDYHHQSVAGSANTIATDNPDELASRAAESVKKYVGPDGQPLPGPINVYGKIVGGEDKGAAQSAPAKPSGPGV